MRRRPLLVALALLAAAPAGAAAQEAAPPEAVADAVRLRVAGAWGVEAGAVVLSWDAVPGGWTAPAEPRVELTGSGNGGWWVAVVSAADGTAPQALRLRAGVEAPVRTAARPLPRGHAVADRDMAWSSELRWGAPRDGDDPDPLGWETRRVIREGEPLREPAVRPPLLVRSGQPVELVWKRGEVGIRMQGSAAGSAPLGGAVLVRTGSGTRLKGVVVAPGIVDVTNGGGTR